MLRYIMDPLNQVLFADVEKRLRSFDNGFLHLILIKNDCHCLSNFCDKSTDEFLDQMIKKDHLFSATLKYLVASCAVCSMGCIFTHTINLIKLNAI